MLAGLRHHAIVGGDHQQGAIDTANAAQHIGEEFFMARYVNKADNLPVGLRPVGVAEVDSHAARFLFRQAVSVDAGNRL